MTIVLALVENNKIIIAGDTSGTDTNGDKESYKNSKVFAKRDTKNNLMLFGVAGEYRYLNIIEHRFKPPPIQKHHEDNLQRFLATDFIDALRGTLRESGAMLETQKRRREEAPGDLIIGINGEIFVVDYQFQVLAPYNPFTAVGSGRDAALGSLGSTKGLMEPEKRVITALEQAQAFDSSVSDPFQLMDSEEAEASVRYFRTVRPKRKR
jgi:ATP-dependent protease HslVU (ClpYQ) peptidase subunit